MVRARRGLLCLGGLATYGVGLTTLYVSAGVGLPCPLRTLTGWECPLCGGTRMAAALVRGEVVGAFTANPALFLGIAPAVVLGLLWTVELLGGPPARLPAPARVRSLLARVRPTQWLAVFLAASALLVVARRLF